MYDAERGEALVKAARKLSKLNLQKLANVLLLIDARDYASAADFLHGMSDGSIGEE